LPAVPAYADALALLPRCDAGAEFGDDAGNFVAGSAWVSQAGKEPVFDQMVTEADCAGLHADADLAGPGLRDLALLEFEVCAGLGDYGDFHFRHLNFLG
jgi:hypothetical protein